MSTASTLFTFTVLHKIQFVLFESAKIPFSQNSSKFHSILILFYVEENWIFSYNRNPTWLPPARGLLQNSRENVKYLFAGSTFAVGSRIEKKSILEAWAWFHRFFHPPFRPPSATASNDYHVVRILARETVLLKTVRLTYFLPSFQMTDWNQTFLAKILAKK